MNNRSLVTAILQLFFTIIVLNGIGQNKNQIPALITPVYDKVKDLHIEIALVKNQKPACAIVTPAIYAKDAEIIRKAIQAKTGVSIPIISDEGKEASIPFERNLIILGNRSTSKISSELYDQHYSLMDLKYPGRGGYSVRSLHNPYANGYSAVLVGGSDSAGLSLGAKAFAENMASLPFDTGNLSCGWIMLTKLVEGIKIPKDLREFETWEDSNGYKSLGYFGWNSISKRMAMYYMTGDTFHAREAIRLSFPDAQALKEIDEIDGERLENKKDPLAGPYHYNALMLILYWDMIEESPVFTGAERLKVTNAFARRLTHEGTTPFDKTTYQLNEVPDRVGSRHDQWSAMSIYTLGRYFNKYYPSPMWAQTERAGKLAFGSLHQHAWVVGESDQLNWYCTGIAPVLTYMIMTGDRVPLENGVLNKLLSGLEVLISGLNHDWALNYAALDFLNKAAYLTGDGRWLTYCRQTGADLEKFRLGQSFWPDKVKPSIPKDIADKWLVNYMPEPMWQKRNTPFTLNQSFQNMSFRTAPDSTGDYILVKGYNGAYRNPYHTYDLLELRLNGTTLLKGFNNQVLSSADGMVEPIAAMDGALIYHDVIGEVAAVIGEVPNLPFTSWRRSLVLRKGRYVLIADDAIFRSDKDSKADMTVRLETSWEIPGGEWVPNDRYIKINSKGGPAYGLHSSEIMHLSKDKFFSMVWQKAVKNGEKRTFFHLLAPESNGQKISGQRIGNNAAVFSLPEAAIAVSGRYLSMNGEMILLSEKTLYGHSFTSVSLGGSLIKSDTPIDADWDFESGKLTIVNSKPATLSLSLSQPTISTDGKIIKGEKTGDLYNFSLAEGRHSITLAKPSLQKRKLLSSELQNMLTKAKESEMASFHEKKKDGKFEELASVARMKVANSPVKGVIIPASQGDLYCTASGKDITVFDCEGKEIRKMSTSAEVKVLHWWPENGLLIAGCLDEKIIAFNEKGEKQWEFTSLMDPAVYEAGKPYWFKSAYPGISGLYSGTFDQGKSRLFVGSACTLEILDNSGRLVKRMPTFWGPGRQFLLVDAGDGSKNLLVGRYNNDFPPMIIINSSTLTQIGRGYDGVPKGFSYVGGWDAINRYDNFLTDLDGDGKREVISAFNGIWNRITVYTEDGKPLYNAQFGPGIKGARTNMRMVDIGDLDGDGRQEIIAGVSTGFVTVLDAQAKKVWAKAFASPPTVVKMIKEIDTTWICVGCEDGSITAIDQQGNILKQSYINGRPVDIQISKTKKGPAAVISAESGEIRSFRLNY